MFEDEEFDKSIIENKFNFADDVMNESNVSKEENINENKSE